MGIHTPIRHIKPTSPTAAAAKELLRRERYERYRKYPLLWAKEILGEEPENFKWSLHGGAYNTHKWDGAKDPLAAAWNAIANKNWVAVPAATGTAKTFWLARMLMWYLDCFENGLIVTSAPKESQLSVNLWSELSRIRDKIALVRPYMKVTKLNIKVEGLNPNPLLQSDSWEMLGFVAGVGAAEESATKAQGFHRKNMLIVCEEMAGMNKAVVTAFTNTAVASTNIIVGVGNPDSENDELHKFSQHPRTKTYRISAYDFPNIVLQKELYEGAVSQVSIDSRKKQYGENTPMYKSRVRGITPTDNESSLILASWVDMCDMRHGSFSGVKHIQGNKGLGVDVAQSVGGDKAALVYFDGNKLSSVHEFQCPNATHLAYNVMFDNFRLSKEGWSNYGTIKAKDLGLRAENIGVDVVGVGVATLNAFIDKGFKNVIGLSGGGKAWKEAIPIDPKTKQPYFHIPNLRNQMMWELREDVRLGNVLFDIPNREEMRQLKSEITAIEFEYKAGGISVESKETLKQRIGKSPNLLDAAAYANWVRKQYRVKKSVSLPISTK